jgi:flagellar hook assembly protein FlgD
MRSSSRRLCRSLTVATPAGPRGARRLACVLGVVAALAVTTAATAATAWAAPPTTGFIVATPGATMPALGAPQGLAQRNAVELPQGTAPEGGAAATLDAGAPFDMIGILFRSTAAYAGDDVEFHVRTSPDQRHWTPWFTMRADDTGGAAGSVESRADLVTEPVWVGSARYVQYEIAFSGAVVPVTDVRLACVESKVTAATADVAAAAGGAQAGASGAVTDGAGVPVPVGRPPEPTIVTRAQWGADEALRAGQPSYGQVRCAFVHHTVNANDYSRAQAPALVRGIYYYHTRVNGWNDIGYNFLIDRFGTIYEGRYGGVARAVIGAQVLGFNSMSTGVSLIGTFQTVAPSKAALRSLEQLLAWKLDLSHLDPQGTARVECMTTQMYRAGQWVRIPVISGHRQVNYTECPGNVLFGLLPTIRAAVAAIGDPKIYTPSATSAAFSPNGDGVRDTTTLHAGLSGADDWTIAVSDATGTVVDSVSGSGQTAATTWSGRDAQGRRLPDGLYTAVFSATSGTGTARPASLHVRIDTVPPTLSAVQLSSPVVSPNGDRLADTVRLGFSVSETSSVVLVVRNAHGTAVRTLTPVTCRAGSAVLVWDGKASGAGGLEAAPDGVYSLTLKATDAAGNSTTVTRSVVVNDTIGHPRLSPAWLSPNGDGVDDATKLSFRTTRSAKVTVSVSDTSGKVVRRVSLGTLAGGAHTWSWDGRGGAGAVLPDGTYALSVKAANTVGSVAVAVRAHVDTTPPSATWSSNTVTMKFGRTVRLGYRVSDALSPRASVTLVVTSAAGKLVKSVTLPAVAVSAKTAWAFKPTARGVYHVTIVATDLAGNRQAAPAALKLTVK